MIFKTFVEPPLENNNYLLIDEKSKDAVLVDCSHYDLKIKSFLDENGATLKYIILTHGHFDHIMGVAKMIKDTGAKLFLHSGDDLLLKDVNSFTFMLGLPSVEVPEVSQYLKDGDIITLGDNIQIKVIHTPGHTKGGVCYLVDNMLFSGDTLFKESIGRTDLEGGSFAELEASIKKKLFILPDDLNVYTGHGQMTTIGHEKKYNNCL